MKSIKLFKQVLSQTNDHPMLIEVESAEGSYITDKSGKKYLDMIAGVSVNNVGHRHPKIIASIQSQLDKYLHTMVYGEFIQEIQNNFADKLLNTLPNNLNSVYIVNSGTEANEAAIKLVRRYTERTEIIAFSGSYHGSTNGSLSISYNETKKRKYRPLLPNIRFLPWNSISDLNMITEKTAGVFLETIQGDAGVRIPDYNFMLELRKKCTETGSLLVLDEIQCGMGRTGSNYAFEHFNIVPDVVTLGKALGGGMPIGALVSNKNILKVFSHDPALGHITTFGGHPINCAAGLAFIQVLTSEIDFNMVEKLGQKIEDSLKEFPVVKEIRRIGFMFAIEMDSKELVNAVVLKCKEKGLISFWFLSNPDCFRLSPPLNIKEEEIDIAIDIIQKSIEECAELYT